MTESEARQILLLQARESVAPGAPSPPQWNAEDRAWATRQAAATVGEHASPERFAVARAVLALQRLLPRDAAAQRWLARRGWHPAWVLLALVLGFVAGVAADQLGPPQRVNLLAPALWAVVLWNLAVYAALLLSPVLPLPHLGLRGALARLGLSGDDSASALWLRHAGPLLTERAALVLHAAAAALGLGLVAGLYLRGLVLDYRAGWQSTFLEPAVVQQFLGYALAPARWLTGIALPDVTALRLGPEQPASATAAPWIHLFAATLALFVLLPRTLLAWRAGARAARLARQFPLPLDTPYFEALHPCMRPGLPRALRLLFVGTPGTLALFGTPLGELREPLALLRSDEGDELVLQPVPTGVEDTATAAAPPWWAFWRAAPRSALDLLRDEVAAVLLLTHTGAPRPPWLAELGRPLVLLLDGEAASEPHGASVPLHARDAGWLAEGRLLAALHTALEGDPRFTRLADTWRRRQQARFDACADELAQTLARVASARQPLAEAGLLAPRKASAEAEARAALAADFEAEIVAHAARMAAVLGRPEATGEAAPGSTSGALQALPTAPAALRVRVGEGRVALVSGVLSGALAGLKADLLTGGLTMGAGAVAGALIGAAGAAGAARGVNVVRGTDRSTLGWEEDALAPLTEALLLRALALGWGRSEEQARAALVPVLAAQQPAWAAAWRQRPRRALADAADAPALAQTLRPLLAEALRRALEDQERGR